MEWQRQQEEEDTIIVKWAQEDVETLYNLLNNNIINYVKHIFEPLDTLLIQNDIRHIVQ